MILDHNADPALHAAARLLMTPPPAVGAPEAEAALRAHYGLAASVRTLPGERDRNFMVETPGGTRRVFKVYHEAEDTATRALQAGALRHMKRAAPACAVPRLVPTRDGAPDCAVEGGGRAYRAILVSVVPGAPCDLASAALGHEVGRAAAEVDLALRDYRHPAARRVLLWDHMQLGRFAAVAATIADAPRRRWLAGLIERFVVEVRPRALLLPAQVIHNDMNGTNVLVAGGAVSGVIDFGDIVMAPRVNEVAVAATYCMAPGRDSIAAIGDVAEGYETRSRLDDAEMGLLHDLVLARLALRLAMYQWRADLFPEHRATLLGRGTAAWRLADVFAGRAPGAGRDAILKRWNERRRTP